ncbi:NAD(P)-dependent oxidoreductase [Chryseolinea sp. T2]|uniref:NAD(P)-dependent oxidoreductase n=1 Tax=Chryseolinea sp. T2 TaxID=3129255 RepID=UPI003076D1B8
MDSIKLGLIREGKVPPDKRVPFTPLQVQELMQRFPWVKVYCQSSSIRCFSDDEYAAVGVGVVEDISQCDVLMGIKEVPVANLLSGKTYLFFSHTIKKQPYNRGLLQSVLGKQIRLIDYEALKDNQDNRLVAFGRYAGIVGAYNGLWTYGRRYGKFQLKRAHECFDVNDLKLELRKVALPSIKIILTGSGRVGKGAMETLDTAGIRKVSPFDFLHRQFNEPVYVQLHSSDYHDRTEGGPFNRGEFHQYPDRYKSRFYEFTRVADVLMAGAFWNPGAPVLFTREAMQDPSFRIKVIADITCDINGSVPSTVRATSIADPVYDFDPATGQTHPGFSNDAYITVMAIDNLPCELPRSASEEFGRDLIDRILKPLFGEDPDTIIERGTIAQKGALMPRFRYLDNYVRGEE